MFRIALLFSLWLASLAAGAFAPGLYFDRTRDGHGLDLHTVSGQLFGAFYTYGADGETTWLFVQTTDAAAPTGDLLRFRHRATGASSTVAGSFSLTPTSACADGSPRPGARALFDFRFTLDGRAERWCLEPLLPAQSTALSALSGAWYTPADPGWGLLAHYYPTSTGVAAFWSVYGYDAQGEPRWAFASRAGNAFSASTPLLVRRPMCLYCPVAEPTQTVGSLDLTLLDPMSATSNRVRLSLADASGRRFERDQPVRLLSAPRTVAAVATTRQGLLRGAALGDGVTSYRAIPYVAPPVGERRWAMPQPPVARAEPLDATRYGPGCPQAAGQGFFTGAPERQSEDCLQLNIWVPAGTGPFPVMLWIHGGGLVQGSAVELQSGRLLYDGEAWARQGVVLVSINYRLGPLGYVALRDLQGSDQRFAGNLGLADQIAALTWVRDNIAGFAGDPNNVTVFGESAGGVSTCTLLAASGARGLFHRAIVQSGNCLQTLPTVAEAMAQGDRLQAALGCTAGDRSARLACLRGRSAEAVIAAGMPTVGTGLPGASGGETYGLMQDGLTLTEPPGRSLRAGRAAQLPLLIGVNDDESTTLAPASTLPATVAGYEAAVRAFLPSIGPLVLQRYPASGYATPQAAYQDLLDDVRFTCAARRAAADHAAHGNPVYHYALTDILPDAALRLLESFHGLDIVYLFGNRSNAGSAERTLAAAMQQSWVRFAQGGDPGEVLGTRWPRYSANNRRSVVLDATEPRPPEDYRREYCDFWALFADL